MPDKTPTTPTGWRKVIDVLRHLEAAGWQIGKTQLYAHCRDGLLRKDKAGVFTPKAVEKYATLHLRRVETGLKEPDRVAKMAEELKEIELKQARLDLESKEHSLGVKKGKFISRDDHETEVAGRVVAFMAQLGHLVITTSPDWIHLVGGDQEKMPHLVAAITEAIEERLADFAAPTEFDIILEADAD